MYKFLCLIFSLVALCSCDNQPPRYIAKTNSYTINKFPSNNNLTTASQIYTYTAESLESSSHKIFCAKLKNCTSNINNVKNSVLFGNFDLEQKPIVNNLNNIQTISLYRILYETPGQLNETRIVSGALFIPNIPQSKIKGIILFFHPTSFAKHSVPSYAPTQNTDQSLAAIFATQGYIIAAPDYIGMGYDESMVHPYVLYPQINAIDGLSMLLAVKQFLREKDRLQQKLPLFITGYSEGGAYALWFSRLFQEEPEFRRLLNATSFNLAQVVPIAGAYDLSGVTFSYLISNVNWFTKNKFAVKGSIYSGALKPSLVANAMLAYAYYQESGNFNQVFNPQFFNMSCSWQKSNNCKFNQQHLNLLQAFHQTSDLEVITKIRNAASFKMANNSIFMNQFNSILPLVQESILTSSQFTQLLAKDDIYYWHSTIPTVLIYLNQDSIVSSYNSIYAYRGMLANHSTHLSILAINNQLIKTNFSNYLPNFTIDHANGLYYLFIVALNQFNQIK